MEQTERYLTETEAAALLKVQPSTLRKWRHYRKGLPYHRVGLTGRLIRYKESDVIAAMESHRISFDD